MENSTNTIPQESATLNKLMPALAGQQRVENSVAHAERTGEKNVRASNEQRIGAHLSRMARLLEHAGVEKRVWDSAVEELVIDPDNVPESYWEQQVQIARDNGYGDVSLGRREKEEVTKQLQEAQRTGLKSWRDYLEREGSRYPLWFKFYVWDGMSRLGTFDKDKGYFTKRSSGTVAPYPQLNPAVLAKVFDAVTNQGESDEAVSELVRNGTFNKLYSRLLLNQKAIIKTPERPEDVHGEWRSYTSKNIKELTEAAEGTPWCIAGYAYANNYTSGDGEFLLFHLQDPETGKVSSTAAASVRLEHGRVVEVSGLLGGQKQIVEDALLPRVEAKVRELPGGEKYLQAFEDKQMLIAMDKKFQEGIPFTLEELLFLYEADRLIKYIGRTNDDPRIHQFKARNYDQHLAQIAQGKGISLKDAELIIQTPEHVQANIRTYLEDGYDPTKIAARIGPTATFNNLDRLLEAGAKINLHELYDQFELSKQLEVFAELQERGAGLDPNELAGRFSLDGKLRNFEALSSIGADIDANNIANSLDNETRLRMLRRLAEIGAKVDVEGLLKKLRPSLDGALDPIGLYLEQGAKPETLISLVQLRLSYKSDDLRRFAGKLVSAGLTGDQVMGFIAAVKKKGPYEGFNLNSGDDHLERVKQVLDAGVEPSAVLRSRLFDDRAIDHNFTYLLNLGVDTNDLMTGLGPYYTSKRMDELMAAGASIADVVEHIKEEPRYLFDNFESLNARGANLDIQDVVNAMKPNEVLYNVDQAIKLGAKVDVNRLLDNTDVDVSVHRIHTLLSMGADPQKIADRVGTRNVGYDHRAGHWTYSFRDTGLRDNYPEIYKLVYERAKRLDYEHKNSVQQAA